ncbi:MAG: hypothetical protein ACRD44_06205 [Bryobacteraceae bacterium]
MRVIAGLLMAAFTIAAFAWQAAPKKTATKKASTWWPKIYRYDPPALEVEGVSENIEVEEIKGDQLRVTVLPGGKEVRDRFLFPLGSVNIRVRVNPEAGSTYIADLRFKNDCKISIRMDGAIEVDSPGIKAEDIDQNKYVSRVVYISGKPYFLMVEDETWPRKPERGLAVTGFLVDRKGAPARWKRVCVVTPTEDGRMAMPFSLAGGRLREAAAVSDPTGKFSILTDHFAVMHLALCEKSGPGMQAPKVNRSLSLVEPKAGRWLVDMGKVVVD